MNNHDTSDSVIDPVTPGSAQAEAGEVLRCRKCGRRTDSLLCGHCGSRLADWQAALYGAAVKQIAKTGGVRTDATNKGGGLDEDGQSKSPAVAAVPAGDGSGADGAGTGQDRKARQEDPDGREYDETVADNIRQAECPYCGKRFPI